MIIIYGGRNAEEPHTFVAIINNSYNNKTWLKAELFFFFYFLFQIGMLNVSFGINILLNY